MSIRDIPRDAPTTHISTNAWHMSEFYDLIKEGNLRKPRIQRKKAWDQKGAPKMTREYIVYIYIMRYPPLKMIRLRPTISFPFQVFSPPIATSTSAVWATSN